MAVGLQVHFRMGSEVAAERKAYAEFREKVRRTVFIDCLSLAATVPVLKTAIGQFGKVQSVRIVPNLLERSEAEAVAQSALVVMEKEAHARAVVEEISNLPFMISGMPRPVRALPAREEMFWDRPKNPDRSRIAARWLDDPKDPVFAAGQRLQDVAFKHARERAALLQVGRLIFSALGLWLRG